MHVNERRYDAETDGAEDQHDGHVRGREMAVE